jgi:ATP-dependent Clp protease ATP-binding subunit ClpA
MDVGTVPDIWAFFDRCTMEARRAVFHARQAVADLGGQAITPEHLLCGLLNADVLASRHFVTLPMAGAELRDRVAALLGDGGVPGVVDVPLSTEAKQVLNRAWAEAEALGHLKIHSDHLLLGVLACESAAASLLKANGLRESVVREALSEHDPDEDEK